MALAPIKAVSHQPETIAKTTPIVATPPPQHLPVIADKPLVKQVKKQSPTAPAEPQIRLIASESGYSPAEVESLIRLLKNESGANPNAVNESSHACGLFQRLSCPWELERLGYKNWIVHASLEEQMANGLEYIKKRYGTASAALKFQESHNWY